MVYLSFYLTQRETYYAGQEKYLLDACGYFIKVGKGGAALIYQPWRAQLSGSNISKTAHVGALPANIRTAAKLAKNTCFFGKSEFLQNLKVKPQSFNCHDGARLYWSQEKTRCQYEVLQLRLSPAWRCSPNWISALPNKRWWWQGCWHVTVQDSTAKQG